MTSVRTGTSHTEHANGDSDVHVLQIWALPRVDGLTPTYYTRQFTDAERKDNWAPTDDLSIKAGREAEWPTPVQATLHLDAALISFGVTAFLDRTNEQVSNENADNDQQLNTFATHHRHRTTLDRLVQDRSDQRDSRVDHCC